MKEEKKIQIPIRKRVWEQSFAKKVDRLSIERYGISGRRLMERAGKAVAFQVSRRVSRNETVVILVGKGNNGGDALVAARYLFLNGYRLRVIMVVPQDLNTECRWQRSALESEGVILEEYVSGILNDCEQPLTVVDGILGLGFKGELRPPIRDVLLELKACQPKRIFAIDLPSGLDPDCWELNSWSLVADYTVTFGGPKLIHHLEPARSVCGEIIVENIGFHKQAIIDLKNAERSAFYLVDEKKTIQNNPWQRLASYSNKYDRGHIIVIGGSPGKYGAAILAGYSSLRGGAGWVTLGIDHDEDFNAWKLPMELTTEPLISRNRIKEDDLFAFVQSRKVRAIVFGPGMTGNPLHRSLLERLSRLTFDQGIFILFDAGALHGLFDLLDGIRFKPGKAVITPHPGEWKKLSKRVTPLVTSLESLKKGRNFIKTSGISCLYKSATPILLSAERFDFYFLNSGDLSLSKAGSGDVLAGVVSAHGALGVTADMALIRSQALVAQAARLAEKDHGRHGVLATDIISNLGAAQSQ